MGYLNLRQMNIARSIIFILLCVAYSLDSHYEQPSLSRQIIDKSTEPKIYIWAKAHRGLGHIHSSIKVDSMQKALYKAITDSAYFITRGEDAKDERARSFIKIVSSLPAKIFEKFTIGDFRKKTLQDREMSRCYSPALCNSYFLGETTKALSSDEKNFLNNDNLKFQTIYALLMVRKIIVKEAHLKQISYDTQIKKLFNIAFTGGFESRGKAPAHKSFTTYIEKLFKENGAPCDTQSINNYINAIDMDDERKEIFVKTMYALSLGTSHLTRHIKKYNLNDVISFNSRDDYNHHFLKIDVLPVYEEQYVKIFDEYFDEICSKLIEYISRHTMNFTYDYRKNEENGICIKNGSYEAEDIIYKPFIAALYKLLSYYHLRLKKYKFRIIKDDKYNYRTEINTDLLEIYLPQQNECK